MTNPLDKMTDMTSEIDRVKEDLRKVAGKEGDLLCRAALRRIEELEAKLAKAVEALRDWIDFANEKGMPVSLSDLEAAELTGGKDD